MPTDSPSKKDPHATRFLFLAIFGGVVLMWGSFILFADAHWKETTDTNNKIGQLGTFGDSFGVLNCLFSGIAMMGVIVTIYKQHQDGIEAEEQHNEGIRAQERIAQIQGLSSLLDFEKQLYSESANATHYIRNVSLQLKTLIMRLEEGFNGVGEAKDELYNSCLGCGLYISPDEAENVTNTMDLFGSIVFEKWGNFSDVKDDEVRRGKQSEYEARRADFLDLLSRLEMEQLEETRKRKANIESRQKEIEEVLAAIAANAQKAA